MQTAHASQANNDRDSRVSVHPEGEALRRALRWISGHLEQDAKQPIPPLVDSATLRFDLTPRESEYLYAFYRGVAAKSADD